MKKYEYCTITDFGFPHQELNKLGAQGWKLITIIRGNNSSAADQYILMKEIGDSEDPYGNEGIRAFLASL